MELMEHIMRKFAVALGAGIAFATIIASSMPASAQVWWPWYGYYDYGYNNYDTWPNVAWCERHYRSYDPASGTYLGYDGFRHACP
jgi:BA14K-like protein